MQAATEKIPRMPTATNLCRDMDIPHNRARNKLRKKANEEQKIHEAALRSHVASVDVNRIRKGLKNIKRNTDRQRIPRQVKRSAKASVDVLYNKVAVLEYAKKGQI